VRVGSMTAGVISPFSFGQARNLAAGRCDSGLDIAHQTPRSFRPLISGLAARSGTTQYRANFFHEGARGDMRGPPSGVSQKTTGAFAG